MEEAEADGLILGSGRMRGGAAAEPALADSAGSASAVEADVSMTATAPTATTAKLRLSESSEEEGKEEVEEEEDAAGSKRETVVDGEDVKGGTAWRAAEAEWKEAVMLRWCGQ